MADNEEVTTGIIDFRCRPCTQEWLEFLNLPFQERHVSHFKALTGSDFSPQTIPEFIQEMDDAGISLGVMCGRDIETTLGWKWSNEKIADIVAQYPERLIGYAGVDPNKGMEAVREVDRAKDLGLKGVALDPFLSKTRADDKKMYPIYAKSVEHGFPVCLTMGISPWGGDWAYMKWSNFMDIDEVATDFPELTIILGHGVRGSPWDVLPICRRHPQVFLETSGLTAMEQEGIAEPMYRAANGALRDQFVFGSAKPYIPLKLAVESFKKLPLSQESMVKVLSENAARILELQWSIRA